jgi:ParB family chromosome partitioning protein
MVRKQLERFLGVNNEGRIINIPIERIGRSPYQARKNFDNEELLELAQSIQSYGVIQPIIVRQQDNKNFQLIAGERRFRACCLIGLREVPAIIHDMDDEKAAAVSLIENLQRRELNYFEEASAYSALIEIFGMTQEELARKVGKSQSAIANKLRLLKLPKQVKDLISPDNISERHARALLKLDSPEMQVEAVKQIYDRELTVKETEELVEKININSIPREMRNRQSRQNVSLIIRDGRIFINTIKETVKRARQTGVDISISERDNEEEHELLIRIAKKGSNRLMAR